MARTLLTPIELPSGYAQSGKSLAFTAGDDVNGNAFVATGKEVLVVRNTGASPGTVTVDSTPDEHGRTGDITAYSVPTGEFAVFQQFPRKGWVQSDGNIHVDVSANTIELAVLRLV